jgi:two-component system, OmpR family, response regulator VicR
MRIASTTHSTVKGRPSSVKKKILIVEDELTLNEAYQMILSQEGYDVHVAYDGSEALELCKQLEPDLILLDLRMPKMGGIEFLREYNLAEEHPSVKVIVFSNLDTQKEVEEAYKLGAQKYMLKAWASPKELAQLVKNTLQGK